MATVAQNIETVAQAHAALRAHCMSARIEETATHVIVWFPPGYSLAGVRVALAMGKAAAYRKALDVAERTWREDLPK